MGDTGTRLRTIARRAFFTVCCFCASAAAQSSATQVAIPAPNIASLIPAGGVAGSQLNVSFNGNGDSAIVFSYTAPSENSPYLDGIVKVMKYSAKGWTSAFEESYQIGPGQDEIQLDRVKAADGKEAVVVVFQHSGAGTTTDWHIIAMKGVGFVVLDPKHMRDKALRSRGYPFMGYNGVKVSGDVVSEELPGYSQGRARCCPDLPSISMNVRFTGSAIKLDSVTEIPGTPR
jgi:hypothetical protein